jgi:predicted MPP superfamily phosphohydrolase
VTGPRSAPRKKPIAIAPPSDGHGRARRRGGRGDRRTRFFRFLLVVTVIVHAFVALGVWELASRLGAPLPWLVGLAWGAAGVALFGGRVRGGFGEHRRHPHLVRFVDVPYFIHWCACVWTIIPAILYTLVGPIVELVRTGHVGLPLGFYMWTYLAGLVVCGYGVLLRRRLFRVRRVEIEVEGLDSAFDGFRIAHLSDLHIGNLTPRAWAERWARAANAEAPDLAVVTGDMVTSGTAFHDDIAGVVGMLEAKHGVFATMGNHDYFGDGEPLMSLLVGRGVKVLRNAGVVLERGDARLYLAGIDDTWTKRDDLTCALRERPDGVPCVLLAHDPERFRSAIDERVELTLSGHTHGGQIAVPFLYRRLSLSHLSHHFHVGEYRSGRSTLYVHPGLGTTGPPMRLGVAPEVVILTLRARAAVSSPS